MKIAVVIVAAGRGRRLGGDIPKQYLSIEGASPLRRVMDTFLACEFVNVIVPVLHPDDTGLYEDAVDGLEDNRLRPPVNGADTRANSVRCGLESLTDISPDFVLIHDAARAFISEKIILAVVEALKTSDGACAALPVVDALWSSSDDHALNPVPREGLWRAQTPQGFVFEKILQAHRHHDGHGADDVAVAREANLAIKFVPGSEQNYKITTVDDLRRAVIDARAQSTQ